MPPQNPITRLQEVILQMTAFADAIDDETDLNSAAIRAWVVTLAGVGEELTRRTTG
jgi:hypothetical protein